MSRMASAPHSMASRIWRASMMKSLRNNGSFTAARICRRKSSEPWKNISSVSTERQLAPAASYSRAMRTGSKSERMTPAELMRYPAETRLQVVAVKDVRASRRLAQQIGCATGTRWCQISAVRRFKGSRPPLCWVDIYVLPEFSKMTELIGRRAQPVYELIEQRFGEKVSNVHVDLRGGRIAAEIAGALAVEPGAASLTVIRRYVGNDSRMFEASISEHPADRYTYSLELRRGWQAGDAWAAN